jgi:hypothetical protein
MELLPFTAEDLRQLSETTLLKQELAKLSLILEEAAHKAKKTTSFKPKPETIEAVKFVLKENGFYVTHLSPSKLLITWT